MIKVKALHQLVTNPHKHPEAIIQASKKIEDFIAGKFVRTELNSKWKKYLEDGKHGSEEGTYRGPIPGNVVPVVTGELRPVRRGRGVPIVPSIGAESISHVAIGVKNFIGFSNGNILARLKDKQCAEDLSGAFRDIAHSIDNGVNPHVVAEYIGGVVTQIFPRATVWQGENGPVELLI